jgi:hypothetical protein
MDKGALVDHNQYNVAGNRRLAAGAFYRQNVAGPERGKHAAPKCSQPYSAAGSQNSGYKTEFRDTLKLAHFAHA